jgi:tetratricopeptide (TPR) repeat protein
MRAVFLPEEAIMKSPLISGCFLVLLAACTQPASDYAKEITGLNASIAQLAKPATRDDALKLVYYRYRLACLSGDYNDFKAVENSIARAREIHAPAGDLDYFSAQFDFKLHRLPAAQAFLARMPQPGHSLSLRALEADIALQQGRYIEALRGYESLIADRRSWDALARLAYYRFKTGQPEEADELYRQAADMIPVKDMRSYAWLELQRGLIDLEYGRYHEALEHYRIADRAYSGYWLIEEHIAEALHLSGQTEAAVALYRGIIERTHNPEFMTALALILETTDPVAANALYREADAIYGKQLALYPEAVAGHLIEHLLQKHDIDPRLREYAEQNHALRPNAEAKLLLARTYLKLGEAAAASALISEILQTPWRTPALAKLAASIGIDNTGKNLNG